MQQQNIQDFLQTFVGIAPIETISPRAAKE
jgi:hypothetical protein